MSSTSGPSCLVYPAPPPTVNVLSSKQRNQLRRSTLKLTKVLGATPQLIDTCISPSAAISQRSPEIRHSQPTLTVSTSSSRHASLTHKRSRTADGRLISDHDADLFPLSTSVHGNRLQQRRKSESHARTSQALEPRRSHSRSISADMSPRHKSLSSMDLSSKPLPRPPKELPADAPTRDSLCDSFFEPEFTIPSPIALRRAKMERVRKVLGSEVPIELVFPPSIVEDDISADEFSSLSVIDITAPSPCEEQPLEIKTFYELELEKSKRTESLTPTTAKRVSKHTSYRESATTALAPILEYEYTHQGEEQESRDSLTANSRCDSPSSSFSSESTFTSSTSAQSYTYRGSEYIASFNMTGLPRDSRREFAVYVPLNTSYQRRQSHQRQSVTSISGPMAGIGSGKRSSSCSVSSEFERRGTQEYEVLRGVAELCI